MNRTKKSIQGKSPALFPRALWSLTALLLPCSLTAQTTTPKQDETVVLSPFEVRTDQDKGYTAASTLSGARLSTSLKETPAVIGVLTKEFLDDIMAQNVGQFAEWAPNTFVQGVDGNINTLQRDLIQPKTRGLSASLNRNYFGTQAPMDGYNTERLEVPRGPNALLYGTGPLAGFFTTNTKRALFGRTINQANVQLDSWGGVRGTIDQNRQVGKTLALRLNGLIEHKIGWRDAQLYNRQSIDGTFTYRPFKNTTIRADAEFGHTGRDGEPWTYNDQSSNWNGTTTAATTTPGQTVGAAGTGTTRRSSATDYLVWTEENPAGGLVDYRNQALSQGTGLMVLLPGQDRTVLRPGKATFGYLPSSSWMLGPRTERNHLRWKNYSVFVEQTVGKLAMELAWNTELLVMNYDRDRGTEYRVDLNDKNPDGSANRHFLDAFAEVVPRQALIGSYSFTTRASAAYPFDFGWMSQQVIVMGNQSNGNGWTRHERMVRLNNPTLRNYQQGANYVQTRRYWSTGSDTPHTEALGSNGIEVGRVTSHSQGDTRNSNSLQAAMVGSYFKRKVSTILGWRTDSITTDTANVFFTSNDWATRGINAATDYRPLLKGETTAALLDPLGRAEKVWSSQRMDTLSPSQPYDPVKNPRYSEIFPLSRRLSTFTAGGVWYPIKSLGVFVNQSTGFTSSGNNYKLDFSPAPPPEKVGIDYGLKVELFDGRLSGTISAYKSKEKGYGATINGNSPPSVIWNQAYLGFQEAAAAASAGGNSALAATYNQKAGEALTNFNSLPAINSATDTQDTDAKGYELDLTARPTPNWSWMFNVGIPKATTTNRLQDYKAYAAKNMPTFLSYVTPTSGLSAVRVTSINTNIINYNAALAQAVDGYTLDQVTKYTANVFNSYRFSQGKLKGLRLGGGANFRGAQRLATSRQVYGLNPLTNRTEFYAPNLFDTYNARGYHVYTAMVGWDTKIRRTKLSLQLNVSNLFDISPVIYTSYSNYTYVENGVTKGAQVPNGYRQLDPRKFSFSATFDL